MGIYQSDDKVDKDDKDDKDALGAAVAMVKMVYIALWPKARGAREARLRDFWRIRVWFKLRDAHFSYERERG